MTQPTIRQYEVTHGATGATFRVNQERAGSWDHEGARACAQVGLRHIADAHVRLVPVGQEIPLAFDEIPVMVRRPHLQIEQEAA